MSVLRPVGPEPAAVYWRRRLVVLVGLLVVVVLVVVLIRLFTGGGDDGPVSAPSPSTSTQTEEQSSGAVACEPADLSLQLAADATDYPEGAQPLFTVTMTNAGTAPCLLDASDAQREIVVTSGSDRIWASTDCGEGEPLQLLLAPEQSDQRQTQWDRSRSDEACSTGLPAPQPGTYQAVLTLNGVSTDPVVFTLG
ncbi:hypothetical protein [Cellulomonas denverensis]|uniref:hypothetical protein n=1 Tax=Cellulomonas denverensis TaxID=264297 RepID=UPI0035E61047